VSASSTDSATSPASLVPSIVFDDTPLDQSDGFWSMADASEIESFIGCTAHQPESEGQPYDLIPHMEAPREKEVMFAGEVNLFELFDRGSIDTQYEHNVNSLAAVSYDSKIPAYPLLQETKPSTYYSTEWHSSDCCLNESLPSPGSSSSRLSFGIR
jgi:hypothetical protein